MKICPDCGGKISKKRRSKKFIIDDITFSYSASMFYCKKCPFSEEDMIALRKTMKQVEYKKPMSGSAKKSKGNQLEKTTASMLHEALMEYCKEYKELYLKLDNPLLKPKKEKSSGAGIVTENTNDVELGIAQPFFKFSIECKNHKTMNFSINNILAGGMSEIFSAYEQAEEHAKHHKGLKPLVVFKANGTKIFCLCKMSDLVNIKEIDFIKKKEYIILLYSDFLKLYLTGVK